MRAGIQVEMFDFDILATKKRRVQRFCVKEKGRDGHIESEREF